jgi:hypothetical protein
MNIEAEKLALIKQILQLDDEEVFTRLRRAVRKALQLPGEKQAALPVLSDEEMERQLQEGRQQAANGDVINLNELTALAQQWRTV